MAITDAPRNPVSVPPRRVPGSVRRTSTLLMSFPGGVGSPMEIAGRCRDLHTLDDGDALVHAEAEVRARATLDRRIEEITASPDAPGVQQLVGARGGNDLRAAIEVAVPEHVHGGTPLHLLLDDLAGGTLIGGFAFFLWRDELAELRARTSASPPRRMQGICAGFRPGSSALNADGTMSNIEHNIVPTAPLVDPDDPDGWHVLDPPPPIATRRARRIDVRVDGDQFVVDAMFRDNSWQPDGSEIAVHEYSIAATADRATGVLTSVHAEPRVLPYRECPAAAPNASRLVGQPVRGLRAAVLATLRDTDCCTHLNDALRALAEVPVLAARL